ncbi:MAG: hypothetical protein JEY96_02775 [Bacteroidales bacterium]|nr:hypothetical protein [Bacteroidales bacterium]
MVRKKAGDAIWDELYKNLDNLKRIFDNIYDEKLWLNGSGLGSEVQSTIQYREFLSKFMEDNEIESVIDYGCGDWQFSKYIDWGNIRYMGIDIVENVIYNNIKYYGSNQIIFLSADIFYTNSSLSADLFLLKDVLQHLSNDNIKKILSIAEKSKYVMITNDYSEINTNCIDGDFRPLDIRKAPFRYTNAREVFAYDNKKTFLIKKT